jgi:hypothetical protein
MSGTVGRAGLALLGAGGAGGGVSALAARVLGVIAHGFDEGLEVLQQAGADAVHRAHGDHADDGGDQGVFKCGDAALGNRESTKFRRYSGHRDLCSIDQRPEKLNAPRLRTF